MPGLGYGGPAVNLQTSPRLSNLLGFSLGFGRKEGLQNTQFLKPLKPKPQALSP